MERSKTEGGIFPLLLRFAVPTTVATVMISLYSLADSLFVSKLGTEVGAAVGVCFAIISLFQAIGYTLGLGSASLISRKLGAKDLKKAEEYANIAFCSAAFIGSLICFAGLMAQEAILRFLGAGEAIFPHALVYSRYLFFTAPFMCSALVLSQILRAEGRAVYSMLGLTVGSLSNIVLDYLFIQKWNIGIAGASLATLISQILSCFVLLLGYGSKQSQIRLWRPFTKQSIGSFGSVLQNGLPSFFRQGFITLATILLNRAAGLWSDAAVVALSVVSRIFLLAFGFCLGIGQGMMPILGFSFGSKQLRRARTTYLQAIALALGVMALITGILWMGAPFLLRIFKKDAAILEIGIPALRAQSSVLILHAVMTCTIMALQAMGRQLSATVLACARQGIFFLPLLFFLPRLYGIEAVIFIQPVSDLLAFFLSIPFFFYTKRLLKGKE